MGIFEPVQLAIVEGYWRVKVKIVPMQPSTSRTIVR
jgi:hypothetical protein